MTDRGPSASKNWNALIDRLESRDADISRLKAEHRLKASTSYRRLEKTDAIVVSVPTPLSDAVPELT